MMNLFLKANLVSLRKINIVLFTNVSVANDISFHLLQDDKYVEKCTILRRTSSNSAYFFVIDLKNDFDFSKRNVISTNNYGKTTVDTFLAPTFENFDEMFEYHGPLGSFYHEEYTEFYLWAPTSPFVVLKLEDENGEFNLHQMERIENGAYYLKVIGNFENKKYHYIVENSGVTHECNDPYGKGASLNSEYSAVINFERLEEISFVKPKTLINNPVDSIIYEVGIRDFTEDKKTNIVNKGKYLGFIEEGRTTKAGHPAGLDYLKYLGITHVQLLPIIDFRGVDDIETKSSYNWGYDPISFFALEGSYSLNPNDPLARLKEVRTLVATLHNNDIRVVMDVVYNHLYEFTYTSLDKIVPNYFFRRKRNGEISNCSGCGNDIASERKMARRIILDSVEYFIEVFDIDGYRFDLMGLIDGDTMSLVEEKVHKLKDDALVYGEGWNMTGEIPYEKRCISENSYKFPRIGFFNDSYRDILKGPTFNLSEKGFLNGNYDYRFGFDFAFHGSSVDHTYPARYMSANQSINYVECHDNHTLFDKLAVSNGDETLELRLRRINLANALVLFSFGVPFIHMGQEIGASKFGLGNTYNVTKVNNMLWDNVDENFNSVLYMKSFIQLRRKYLPYVKLHTKEDIDNIFNVEYWDNDIMCFVSKNATLIDDRFDEVIIMINISNETKFYKLDEYYTLVIQDDNSSSIVKNGMIGPASILILGKRRDA